MVWSLYGLEFVWFGVCMVWSLFGLEFVWFGVCLVWSLYSSVCIIQSFYS